MVAEEERGGSDSVLQYFRRIMQRGQVSHAYLLEGGAGPEKLASAVKIAQLLQCDHGTGCGECAGCRAVAGRNHPDVLYVTHEKPNLIRISEIREQLVDDIQIRPYRSSRKIYIVDEADKMNPEAQNALLKTLEEPPSYGIIFLLASNGESFLPTILSRVIRLRLTDRGVVSDKMAEEDSQAVLSFLADAWNADYTDIVQTSNAWKERDLSAAEEADVIRLWFRDVLFVKSTGSVNRLHFSAYRRELQQAAQRYSYTHIRRILESVDRAEDRIASNMNQNLTVAEMLAEMTSAAAGPEGCQTQEDAI